MQRLLLALLGLFLAGVATAGTSREEIPIRRTNNRSPLFRVPESDVDYFMNYTGFSQTNQATGEGQRCFTENIGPKVLEMLDAAERCILLSVFLFDSLYATEPPERDIVKVLSDKLLEKRRMHPDMSIAIILDPSHKAYGQRLSPVERSFRENGIDVFYSDLLSGLKKASLTGTREGAGHISRVIDHLTFNKWTAIWSGVFSQARLPVNFDGDPATLETAYNAFLMKANHRKLLVTDVAGTDLEALVTSANPHNASAFHVNSAVSVKGAPAYTIYRVLLEDMRHSAGLGKAFAHWHYNADRNYRRTFFSQRFPERPLGQALPQGSQGGVGVCFVTEEEIPRSVIRMLRAVEPDDEVRIQMFYLSFQPVMDAILEASRITQRPVRLILDANKDSFNMEKDGTPNRQAARYLLREASRRGGRIRVRWYSTHGEQNHAKTMSITNARKGTHKLTTGSCNWTGRNMDGVNMESNIILDGSPKVTRAFNDYFDLFWSNGDGKEYSLDYEVFRDQTAPDWRWKKGEKPYYWSTF